MARFYGDHPGTRQVRGRRKVKPANHEERLASMRRELATREAVYGPDHWFTQMQRDRIAKEIFDGNNESKANL